MIMMALGPQLTRSLHITTNEFSLLLSSYTFAAAASGLLAATYIDRFDRRKLMLVLYVLFILATLGCSLAPTYSALLFARATAGAFGGILGAMVQTIVADLIPFARRGKATGMVMTAVSIASVAGVPLGLFLANHIPMLGWRAPFFFIVLLSGVILSIGYKLLPSLTGHLNQPRQGHILTRIYTVAKDRHHLKAYAFLALTVTAGFAVIPYIALYVTANVGMPETFLSLMYLCGGAATFFTSQLIGRMADKCGKPVVFRWVALASFGPILVVTHLAPAPWWVVLASTTLFFILVPGRLVPGMAMVSAVALPQVRGTFMSLASSLQMLSVGMATLISGTIITRSAEGQILHFNIVGYFALACGILSVWLGRQLRVAPGPGDGAKHVVKGSLNS